jgi:hypothetical protein
MTERVPFDVVAYERRVRAGGCFICGFLAGKPGMDHELLYDDGPHVASARRVNGWQMGWPHRMVSSHRVPPTLPASWTGFLEHQLSDGSTAVNSVAAPARGSAQRRVSPAIRLHARNTRRTRWTCPTTH